jgi:hypothetical protein
MTSVDLLNLDPAALRGFSDDELTHLVACCIGEQRRRALDTGDPAAVLEDGFREGFDSKGRPVRPWLHQGVLVCPGWKADRSKTSHDCSFVAVGDEWSWLSEYKLLDVVRQIPGAKPAMRSVSLITAFEGLEFDQVKSKTVNGVHQMQEATSFVVTGGSVEVVKSRKIRVEAKH